MSKLLVVLGVLPVAPLAILTDLSAVSSGRHLVIFGTTPAIVQSRDWVKFSRMRKMSPTHLRVRIYWNKFRKRHGASKWGYQEAAGRGG